MQQETNRLTLKQEIFGSGYPDFIYAENDATGTTGSVTNAYFGSTVNGTYTGPYAVFSVSTRAYNQDDKYSNVKVGDQFYNYIDGHAMQVIKKDTASDFAHYITVVPFATNYCIRIFTKHALLMLNKITEP